MPRRPALKVSLGALCIGAVAETTFGFTTNKHEFQSEEETTTDGTDVRNGEARMTNDEIVSVISV
jgi:hypothetical protein